MDASGNDDDIVHFSYPITVIYRDFTEITVSSHQQFEELSGSCDDDGFHEIRCLNFNFPLRINTYNISSQIAGSTEINDDTHLYGFLHNASADDLIGISFPIIVTNANGDNITISSNADLENAIEDSIGTCDSDDHGGGPEPMMLSDIIINGSWHVSYCQGPDEQAYAGYSFTFLTGGAIDVLKNNTHTGGTWNLHLNGEDNMLDFLFTNNALHELEGDWKVVEYSDEEIRLKKDDDSPGGPGGPVGPGHEEDDYLYFMKN